MGRDGAVARGCLATGELSALTALSEQVRNDAAGIHARLDARERDLNARADAITARELQHAVSVTNFVDFVGKASVLFDKLERARADAEEEPLAAPPVAEAAPGEASDPSKQPEPELELEGDNVAGTSPGEPSEAPDEVEFPTGELPAPPVTAQPTSPGLDEE